MADKVKGRWRFATAGALALALGCCATHALAQGKIALSTNQSYIEDVQSRSDLPLTNTREMFSRVLGSLPERVKVYPTENYFYFSFFENGVRYAGNIRLDASNRDQGKVHFAYYLDLAEWGGSEDVKYLMMDTQHGVKVEKIEELVYRVSDGKSSVIFELNDLRGVKPPDGLVLKNERYIGPIHDESGIRFFLVYNSDRRLFHYVLDETKPVDDKLEPGLTTDRILIGRRTGFAFYKDHRYDRKILIGVFEANSRVNNYFDGPFDQLPDNFIEGESLRSALLEIEPSLRGKIDRFGGTPGGGDRYMIAPYHHYRTEEDLAYFHNCAVWPQLKEEAYPSCFVYVEAPPEPEPVAQAPVRKKNARKRN
jgi:hypothetical protein